MHVIRSSVVGKGGRIRIEGRRWSRLGYVDLMCIDGRRSGKLRAVFEHVIAVILVEEERM